MILRSFLVGVGSALLTAGFYCDVVRFIERKDEAFDTWLSWALQHDGRVWWHR